MSVSVRSTSRGIDWGQYACDYAALIHLNPYRDLQQYVGSIVSQHCRENSSLLDLGCGIGSLWQYLPQNLKITAIDGNSQMLNFAQNCADSRTIVTHLHDLNTPFINRLDCQYDLIVSVNALYSLTQKSQFILQCFRALKSSGIFVLVDLRDDMENGLILKSHCQSDKPDAYWYDLHHSQEREFALLAEAFANEPSLLSCMLRIAEHNRIINNSHFTFCTPHELCTEVTKSGFITDSVSSVYANQATCIVASKC